MVNEISARNRRRAIVVGAGVAGLIAARDLVRGGWEVRVLEADAHLGHADRIRRTPDGYLIVPDGGVVVWSGMTALNRHVDLDALGAAPLSSDVIVWDGAERHLVQQPLREPQAVLHPEIGTRSDIARLGTALLTLRHAASGSVAEIASAAEADLSARGILEDRGFSDTFIERIARPFLGAATLDPELAGSAASVSYVGAQWGTADAMLLRDGLTAILSALATSLPRGVIAIGRRVTAIASDGRRATGVHVGDELLPAEVVIVATDPRVARELTGIAAIPTATRATATVFLGHAGTGSCERRRVVDGTGALAVTQLVPISDVQPTVAPAGRRLVAAQIIREEWLAQDDLTLGGQAAADVATLTGVGGWEVLAVERDAAVAFVETPGIHRVLPDATTGIPGLVLATATVDASLNGAVLAGESAARAADAATLASYVPD